MAKRRLLRRQRLNINSETQVEQHPPSPIYSQSQLQSQAEHLISHIQSEHQYEIQEETELLPQKRRRGPTRMSDVWDVSEERIIVSLNDLDQPIGDEACWLTRFIGTMVRSSIYAPINFESWKNMSNEYKEMMLDVVESKFQFISEPTEILKKWLLKNMAEKWRQWKGQVKKKWKAHLKKKGYDGTTSMKRMTRKVPDPRVDKKQFKKLVKYWCTEEAKKISEKNKINRSKCKDLHCSGTKSFARLREELTRKEGDQVSRANVFIASRTRRIGGFISIGTKTTVEKMDEMIKQNEGLDNAIGTGSWEGDVYSKVKGPDKRGHVRCVGMIAKPKKATSLPNGSGQQMKKMAGGVNHLISILKQQNPDMVLSPEVMELVEEAQQIVGIQGVSSNGPINGDSHFPDAIDGATQDRECHL